ncbi:hypothetical protein [Pseudomonas sp.]|uniref:hypothetical protein n=1 Tax=Pseudomonas sp. TaxID=306 RepID=UPI003FD88037
MKQAISKFLAVPSFRKASIGMVGAASVLAAGSSFADDLSAGALTAITSAQSQGSAVGGAVVACVAALCVVGVIIALVRKV